MLTHIAADRIKRVMSDHLVEITEGARDRLPSGTTDFLKKLRAMKDTVR